MQTTLIPNSHGLGRMGYPERFGKSHPEYFALRANGTRSVAVGERMGGHLCFSSPVVEEIYQDAKAYLTGKSAKERGVYVARWKTFVWDLNAAYGPYFNLMPQDGMTGCLCPQCRKLAAADPSWLSEQIWNLTVNISKRLKKDGVKGYVTQMAYGIPRTIPSCDIPADIPVQVALDGPWSLDKKANWEKQDKVLTDWVRKLGHQVYLWNYVCKYSARDIRDVPCSTPRAVAAYYSKIKDRSFGAYMESDTDQPSYQVFNKYVFAKMMWNKELDGVKLYEDTCRDLFGKAAPAMLKFFDRLENQWLKRIANNVVMAPSGPVGVAPNERTLWEKIYSPAFRAELRKDINAAKNAVRTDRDALRRVVYFEREYLNRLNKAAGQFAAAQKARELCFAVVADSRENAKKLMLRNPGKTPTVVRVWKDENNLYVGGDCIEPEMDRVFTQKLPADDPSIWTLNCMEIFLDPEAAGKEYYQFMVSSDGQFCDLKADKVKKITDVKWNSGAKLNVGTSANGWIFTLTIPLKALGPVPLDRIGADFSRSRVLKGEKTEYTRWSPFVRKNGDAENFGFLYLKEPPQKNMFRTPTFAAPKKGRSVGSWLIDNKDVQLVTLDKEEFMFDGQSMRLENPDKRNLNVSQYIKGLEGGKRYRIRIFMRTALKSGSAFMQLWNGRNYAFPNGGAMGNTPWTAYSYEFTADKEIEKKHPYLRLYLYKGEGRVWFDGAVLEKIEP